MNDMYMKDKLLNLGLLLMSRYTCNQIIGSFVYINISEISRVHTHYAVW